MATPTPNPIATNQAAPIQQGANINFPIGDTPVNAGINVRYLQLNNVRLKMQIITVKINTPNTRFAFETQAQITNDRIIGIILTSNETGEDITKQINESTMQLTIDNEEILPDGFDCSLISAKSGNSFFENVYPCNERADGSLIKGYIASTNSNNFHQYTVKINLWSVTKPKK